MLSSSPKWSIFLARSDIQFNARLSFVLADSLQEGRDTMKRTIIASLVLVLILLTATPLLSQTRPRRVGRTTDAPVEEPIARPRDRSWTRVLLGTGISIGESRGRRSCTPSRDIFRPRPRL